MKLPSRGVAVENRHEELFLWQSNCQLAQGVRCPGGVDPLGAGWGSLGPLASLGPSHIAKMHLLNGTEMFVRLPWQLSGGGRKANPH